MSDASRLSHLRMRNLTVQVIQGHGVLVDDPKVTDACCCEVQSARAAEAARSDDERGSCAEARLCCTESGARYNAEDVMLAELLLASNVTLTRVS